MNQLSIIGNANLTMSSREIADLCEKQHKDVMRDIRVMLDELGETSAQFCADLPDSYGRLQPVFNLPKDLTLTLVAGYNVKLRKRIIDRWIELEAGAQSVAIPRTFAEALRLAADLEEQKQIAEQQRDIAIATKAEIGSRREATAMNTASQAVKKANSLEIQLDRSKQYATVKRMEMLYHGQRFNWRLLKATATEMQVPPIDVFDQNYGKVNAYHADVWMEVYALPINLEEAA